MFLAINNEVVKDSFHSNQEGRN